MSCCPMSLLWAHWTWSANHKRGNLIHCLDGSVAFTVCTYPFFKIPSLACMKQFLLCPLPLFLCLVSLLCSVSLLCQAYTFEFHMRFRFVIVLYVMPHSLKDAVKVSGKLLKRISLLKKGLWHCSLCAKLRHSKILFTDGGKIELDLICSFAIHCLWRKTRNSPT